MSRGLIASSLILLISFHISRYVENGTKQPIEPIYAQLIPVGSVPPLLPESRNQIASSLN